MLKELSFTIFAIAINSWLWLLQASKKLTEGGRLIVDCLMQVEQVYKNCINIELRVSFLKYT